MWILLCKLLVHQVVLHGTKFLTDNCDQLVYETGDYSLPIYDVWLHYIGVPLIHYNGVHDVTFIIMCLSYLPVMTFTGLETLLNIHITVMLIRLLAINTTIGYVAPKYTLIYQGRKKHKSYISDGITDMAISGHAISTVLVSYLMVTEGISILYKLYAIFMGILNVVVIMLVGEHYTADIVIGIGITILALDTRLNLLE